MKPRPRVLYSRRRIARRVREIAREIDRAFDGREIVLCGVLTGGCIFAADLARALRTDRVALDFVKASSYGDGTVSRGRVRVTILDAAAVRGRDVLIAEDIYETGRTLEAIARALRRRGARSVRVAVLLVKPGKRRADLLPDWVGFTMAEDAFVAGYGLDAGGLHRNLPDIVVPPARGRRGR